MAELSRRDFLKLGGVAAGALAVGLPQRTAQAARADVRKVPTLCEMCTSRCGVFAVVENGRVTRIEGNPAHPINLGRPCARGNAGASALYDPDRLKEPMKRGEDGKLYPITWEQAFEEIGAKLNEIRKKHGPEALVFAEYNNLNSALTKRWTEAFGSPNHVGHAANCFANRNVGYSAVFGALPTVDYAERQVLPEPRPESAWRHQGLGGGGAGEGEGQRRPDRRAGSPALGAGRLGRVDPHQVSGRPRLSAGRRQRAHHRGDLQQGVGGGPLQRV